MYIFNQLSQIFPPKPKFTEKELPDLAGKVYIVTGANTGVGKELAQILYSKNARVYVAARSKEKAEAAITSIREAHPTSTGELVFLLLDLADLSTIKASAQQFLDREEKLHVLFNNAGVMQPPAGSKTAQGYELQLGVNNIGTFLFSKLLTPILVATAKAETEAPGSVRIVWVGSSASEAPLVPKGGINMADIDKRSEKNNLVCYALSKAGNYLHGAEFAQRYTKETGVVSVALNPGNLNSDLWRTQGTVASIFLKSFVLHPSIYGAYTELFAGLSPAVTVDKSGEWIVPWGRFMPIRADMRLATKSKEEGGHGTAKAFWEWCDEQVKPYL